MGDYVNITILEKEYNIPCRWKDITLSQAQSLKDIIEKNIPDSLREKYKILDAIYAQESISYENLDEWEKTVSDAEILKEFPRFYGRVIAYLGNIPLKVIESCHREDRQLIYENYLEHIVHALLHSPVTFDPTDRKQITIDGSIFKTPEYRWALGKKHPMGNATVIEFTEAADLECAMAELGKGSFDALETILAILLRPEGEEYDEKTVLDRIRNKTFGIVDMEMVYNVFFYLRKLLTIWQIYSLRSSLEGVKELQNEQKHLKSLD